MPISDTLPWDVFHVGFAKTIGISIGNASIIVGLAIGVIAILLGEKLGLGTILNMVLIGVFMDMLLRLPILPLANSYIAGLIMMIVGLFLIALASYYYIGSAFGAGPRDSLMVALTRKTGLPVGICRGIIELLAAFCGWRLGGMLGIGTVMSALLIGVCIQITFQLLKFDSTTIKHETLDQTYQTFFKNKKNQPDADEIQQNE